MRLTMLSICVLWNSALLSADFHLRIADIEALAQSQSLALKAQELEKRIAEAGIQTAGLWENPELQLQYDYQALTPSKANNPSTIDMRISQPLRLFGLRSARIEQAKSQRIKTYFQTADFRRTFVLQLKLAAFRLLVLNKAVLFQKVFYENYQKLLQAMAFRYKKGDISEYELRKIEVEGTRYENSLALLEIERQKKTNDLKKALSMAASDSLTVEDDWTVPSSAALSALFETEHPLEERPDLLVAQNEIALAEKSLRVAEKENMPDFAAEGIYHYEPPAGAFAQNHYFGLGVTAPLKIFNRNQGVREAYKHTVEQKKMQYQQELMAAKAEITTQRNAVREYFEVLSRGEARLTLSRELYEKGRLLYIKKAANLVQLLESERSFFETQREYFEILYNFQEGLETYRALTQTITPKEKSDFIP